MSFKTDEILHAYSLTGDGHGIELRDIEADVSDNAIYPIWVHLDATHETTTGWLAEHFPDLDSLVIEALAAEETRPRLLEFADGVLLILRGVNLNENSVPEDMVSIRLWVDDKRVISLRRRPLKAISDLNRRLQSGTGPRTPGDLVTMLISRLFDRMEPVFSELDEQLDDLEEQILEVPDPKNRIAMNEIRRQAIMFRRYVAPQKDAIALLRIIDSSWLETVHKRRLQEDLDKVTRYVEDLDAIRERAQVVKDELASVLADRMNRNTYVLSVIAAIFLPLGFLTGLLGINVGGIPGADNPWAFAFFVGLLIAIVALQVWVFRRLKWF